jgi:hypothetical protein
MAKDYTKYGIEGVAENLGKSRLALAIIEDYVTKNSVDFEMLHAAFPDKCQGGIHGVFRKKEDVKDAKRYYMGNPISLIDSTTIVVTNQWGIDNIQGLITSANKVGYEITHTKIKIEDIVESTIEKSIVEKNKDVTICISGQITSYYFATIDDNSLSEFKIAIGDASNKEQNMEAFLQNLLSLTLSNGVDNLDDFKANLNMVKIELSCPKLFEIISTIENGNSGDHYWLYEQIFSSAEEVVFIEGNSEIAIYIDNDESEANQNIIDFGGEFETVWLEDMDQKSVNFEMLTQFHSKNMEEFGLTEEFEELGIEVNNKGIMIVDNWISPPSLVSLTEDENQIKIEHKNTGTYTYNFEDKNFNLSKLIFLKYSNALDFTNSSNNQIGSYLFYDNEMIRPDVNIDSSDDVILSYNPAIKSLSFLLEG